ncbi:MAG: hypothetical protein LBG74_04520 [Spirochaetaceae bacterium]|jgi:hypothetical protein|nr:hypothetical protein [Spirochaetaceae bacterium]
MGERVGLYTILRSFAGKTRNASIPLVPFIRFLQNNAGGDSPMGQRLADWAVDTHPKVIRALDELVRQSKVEMREEDGVQTVILLGFYAELVAAAYTNIDDTVESPLPDEKSLRITLPADQTRTIIVGNSLVAYLADPQSSVLPVLKLVFPDSNGSALALSSHLPGRLLEIALSKIRDNFNRHGTLEFFAHKLITHFNMQEAHMREFVKTVINHPNECISNIVEGSDFSFSVWMFLCQLIKNYVGEQVERANDRKPWHMALGQAADIVLSVSNYYKASAMDMREKEITFDGIIKMFSEPPYLYGIKDIYTFQTPKKLSVIEVYGEKEVSDYVKQLTTSAGNSEMPEIIKFNFGGEESLVKKDCIIPLCKKLIQETNAVILQEIKNRWTKKLEEYHSDSTMRFDDDFEEMLEKLVHLFAPALAHIGRDKRTAIVQEEAGPYPVEDMLFSNYRPIPWRTIFKFKRDSILMSCRLSLPFWYSFPLVVKIISFVKYGPKAFSEAKRMSPSKKKNEIVNVSSNENLKTAAQKIAERILPEGASFESYLELLNDRWNHILNKKDRDKLTRDINSIIKTYMAQELKIQTRSSITESALDDTSHNIIDMHKPLRSINDKNSLRLYVKTYILKLLVDAKF